MKTINEEIDESANLHWNGKVDDQYKYTRREMPNFYPEVPVELKTKDEVIAAYYTQLMQQADLLQENDMEIQRLQAQLAERDRVIDEMRELLTLAMDDIPETYHIKEGLFTRYTENKLFTRIQAAITKPTEQKQ